MKRGDQVEGVAASPGIAIGKALLKRIKKVSAHKRRNINYKAEMALLDNAIKAASEELLELESTALKTIGKEEAEIFTAQRMILEDPELIAAITKKVSEEMVNVESAAEDVFTEFAAMLQGVDDGYIRDRVADVEDVKERLLSIFYGKNNAINHLDDNIVIVAKDLTPSHTMRLDLNKVLAFVTAEGSRTSHTAILARSMCLPAVVGVGEELLESIENHDLIIVDGYEGRVIINPSSSVKAQYEAKKKHGQLEKKRLSSFKTVTAQTKDGIKIEVSGNTGNLDDVNKVIDNGGEGIGLFRTEFLFMGRTTIPSEQEQFLIYKQVAEVMGSRPVIIRTLDIGGDKEIPFLKRPPEMNPFLGYRAIRLCLNEPEIFMPQLRAILRASAFGNIKIMFPMITSLDELQSAYNFLREAKLALQQNGILYNEAMPIGIMIEVPSAVMIADKLAGLVDFFSIGTNDLVQYTLAVDRTNESIAHLYSHYHPALLRMIKSTIEAGHRAGIWVGMCGEAAGDPLFLPFLIGVDIDELSMSATSILSIKELMSFWTKDEARIKTEALLSLNTEKEVRAFFQQMAEAAQPRIL